MTITWLQAFLLGLFACLSSVTGMGGTTIGNYTLGRPLVGGLICGIILKDIQTGVLVGCAIQIVFIALTTPGCVVSADVRAICYIGIPLAMIALRVYGLSATSIQGAALATSYGAFIGILGTKLCTATIKMNNIWVNKGWISIQNHNYQEAYKVNMFYPWIAHFFFSFLPSLILCRFGYEIVETIKIILPLNSIIMKTILAGGILIPCIGIANVLQVMVQNPLEFIPYFFGFTLAASLKINLVSCATIAAMFAYVFYQFRILKLKMEEEASKVNKPSADDYEEGI
ncbi:MAG: PTS sugar transporter subunit IIC [Bacillota bacterium]|nr:PTS sugar transporter subunit IIC [Bacillota bacterium]